MEYYLGIDLGGTNVRVAKVSKLGEVIEIDENASRPKESAEVNLALIVEMIKNISNYEECKAIGIGVPGPVDNENGIMKMATNLPAFQNFPLGKEIEKAVNLPTFLENDANVAGLGEAVLGSGKEYSTVYYITISTGIGGAFIVNHEIIGGQSGHAGEVNNIIVRDNGKKINELNLGAVENEASGTAMTRKGKTIFGEEILHAGMVFDLVDKEEKAKELVEEMTTDLAKMLCAISHTVDPHIFIFGGGMMKSKEVFFEKMKEKFYTMVHSGMKEVKIEIASLKEPGVVGAAMLARTKFQKENR